MGKSERDSTSASDAEQGEGLPGRESSEVQADSEVHQPGVAVSARASASSGENSPPDAPRRSSSKGYLLAAGLMVLGLIAVIWLVRSLSNAVLKTAATTFGIVVAAGVLLLIGASLVQQSAHACIRAAARRGSEKKEPQTSERGDADIARCWNCGHKEPGTYTCSNCKVVQAPSGSAFILANGKAIVVYALTGGVLALAAGAKDLLKEEETRLKEQEARLEEQRANTQKFAESFAAFRSALTEFGSDCTPRVTRSRGTLSDVSVCGEKYDGLVRGWVHASWYIPFFLEDIKTAKHCELGDGGIEPGDGGTQPHANACNMLTNCPKATSPADRVSVAYRQFVNAYMLNIRDGEFRVRVDGRTNWKRLQEAFVILNEESRTLGCALMIAGFSAADSAQGLGSAYCNKVALAKPRNCDSAPPLVAGCPTTSDGGELCPIEWADAFEPPGAASTYPADAAASVVPDAALPPDVASADDLPIPLPSHDSHVQPSPDADSGGGD